MDTNEMDTNEMETIDTRWLDEFKKNEQVYQDFYTEPVHSITLFFLYVNPQNEMEHIHTDLCLLTESGLLKREVIISYIKRYEMLNHIKYKLRTLLRYNINLEPAEINTFVNQTDHSPRFFSSEKYLNDIRYEPTIHMFQDLNALYFIFHELVPSNNQTTRRVILTAGEKHNKKGKQNKTKREPMHREPMHREPMHREPMHREPMHREPMHREHHIQKNLKILKEA